MLRVCATIAASLHLAACAAERSPPRQSPLVAGLDHAQVLERSRETEALTFADFTADWCAPCRDMERHTWPDPRIAEWLARRSAVVYSVRFDPDTMAAPLDIRGIPLVIAYRRGRELDRLPSRRSADEVLAWFETVAAGKTHVDALRQAAALLRGTGSPEEAVARFDLGSALARTGRFDQAAPELVWLWQNRPLFAGAPASRRDSPAQLPELIRQTVEARPDTRAAFDALRDPADADDFLRLSDALGDTRAMADWFDRLPDPASHKDRLASHRAALWSALIAERRYAAALGLTEIFVPATTYARNRLAPNDPVRRVLAPAERARVLAEARPEIADLYAALLVAHRDDDAASVANLLIRALDDADSRLALVQSALRAGAPRASHRAWLDQVRGRDTAALRAELEAALGSSPSP